MDKGLLRADLLLSAETQNKGHLEDVAGKEMCEERGYWIRLEIFLCFYLGWSF